MKILNHFKLVLLIAVCVMVAGQAYSYPPDNAAVLYYKAAMRYQVDDEMKNTLEDLREGKITVNDKIKEFVKNNRIVIKTVLDASDVKNCDWGMDFPHGFEDLIRLGIFKKLADLVIADAKIMAQNGDYDTAIGHCMSVYKMARHINEHHLYVSYLVGISINAFADNGITQIMADMPQNTQNITNLKNQLIAVNNIPFSFTSAALGEHKITLLYMTKERLPDITRLCIDKESDRKKILSFDETTINRNRAYYENYCNDAIAAFDMPYIQGYEVLIKLHEKITKDVNDPNTMLAYSLAPFMDRIFSLTIRFKTHNNAIKTAIELYMIKAKTGKLPDTLPADLPGDLFSGKPFQYEKTAEGLILRCQGQDLPKKEIYEYKFKVK